MTLRFEPRAPLRDDQIRAVVLGQDKTVPRGIGFTLLRLSRDEEKVPVMREVLLNEREPAISRRMAAQNLYLLDTEPARGVLLEAARSVRDDDTLVGVAQGLGRTGDESALPVIEELAHRRSALLARQASFAASLLTHRLGLRGHDLEPPSRLLDLRAGAGLAVKVMRPEDEEARLCLDSLATEPFGIKLGRFSLQQLECERNRWMMVQNEALAGRGALEQLRERKSLLGMIASKNTENNRYSVIYLILTSPTGERGRVRLHLTRTTGETGFYGEAHIAERGAARFEVRSADQPGVFALDAKGTYDEAGRLQIDDAVSALKIENKRNPSRLRPGR